MASKPLLIAMMGLPRSGKSTISRALAKQLGAPIVNRDALRLAIHGQRYASEAEPLVKAVSLYMIRALFGAGHEVVIYDETNYSQTARDYIKDSNWHTEFYVVTTSSEICKARAITTNQPDLLPVIDEMVSRYQPLRSDEKVYDVA
jgi:predicted kinase